jgi:putative flippase GtrA
VGRLWWWKRSGSIFQRPVNKARDFFAANAHRLAELWRYYYVGLFNTAFGYGLYALLIFFGLNLFIAQIVAHVSGATFNYFMFKRHVFRNSSHSVPRYIVSYAFNYLIGLACLTVVHQFVKSAYLAGLGSLIITAMINYFVLKLFVFRDRNMSRS